MAISFIGALLGNALAGGDQAGRRNTNAGAVPEYDDDGNLTNYKLPDGSKIEVDKVKKTGTSALERPSAGQRLFNREGAARIDSINSQFNALPAEAQQRYNTEIGQLEDRIRTADPTLTEQIVHQRAAQVGTRAFSMGYGPKDAAAIIEGQQDLSEGGPTARGSLSALSAKNALDVLPLESATHKAFLNLSKAGSESRLRLVQPEEATRKAELQRDLGSATAETERQPLTSAVLNQEAINRLSEATGITPTKLQVIKGDLEGQLGRQATENELYRRVAENKLFEQNNIAEPELRAGAEIAKGRESSASMARQATINETANRLLMSHQPPDIGRPTLYRMNPGAVEGGDLRKAYTSIGINPTFKSPLDSAMAMQSKMNQGGGGAVTLSNGQRVIGGQPRPAASAPITTTTAPPMTQPTARPPYLNSMSFKSTNAALPAVSLGNDTGLQPNTNPRLEYLLNKQKTYTLSPAEETELNNMSQ